ncbi:MAG: hypothetical protein NWE91_02650 [Candidatus Bathyarchaeota archaeon]|nr:hypothetical protein [Candidatus Bathyarchaeota archaeon]
MNYLDLTNYWITKHNKNYYKYMKSIEEPRYGVKTFFLNSYYLFRTLGEEWENYLERYPNLFKRDPANDYYKYRDPTERGNERQNSLEWTTAFEIVAGFGFPHNESAKEDFLIYSKRFLERAMRSPNTRWVDFMLASAVAHLPNQYVDVKERLPSQLEKHVQNGDLSPHHLMIYLKALRQYEGHGELRARIVSKLMNWIQNPVENYARRQILILARLITRMQWLKDLTESGIKEIIANRFIHALNSVHHVDWSCSPMILEACFICADETKKDNIQSVLARNLTPSTFFKFQELFPFLNPKDNALEVQSYVTKIREKCKPSVSENECRDCMEKKQGDCWIRILAKLTNTEPKLHSGYEIADKVIYSLQQGVYIVIKADPISRQRGEGDVLYRQCGSLFSIDHALVLYLNPCETAPFVIEEIRRVASNSAKNPRFEVIDQKYIRQMYKEYLRREEMKL